MAIFYMLLQQTALAPPLRSRAASGAPYPFAVSPLCCLLFAAKETIANDNNPEPDLLSLRDNFGQGYW